MKLGTEHRKTTITAVALLLLGALLLYRGMHSLSAGASVEKKPLTTESDLLPRASGADSDNYRSALLKPTPDPHLRLDLLANSEEVRYQGDGRDIFSEHVVEDIPKPVAPGLLAAQKPEEEFTPPPPPPPPPPIDLRFWGWASREGEGRAVFLAQGDSGFVAHEGDIVARRYKVLKIGSSSIEIQDLLSNNRQSIPVKF